MPLLFGRSFKLVIGAPDNPALSASVSFNDENATGFDISGLDCEFEIEKTLKPEPNTLRLNVYNLSETTRRQFEGAKKLTVRLEAGYSQQTALLWLGETRAAWSTREGPDIVTHIEAGDGETACRTARIQACLGPTVSTSQALSVLAQAMGVGVGNLAQALGIAGAKLPMVKGTFSGSCSRRLTDICRSCGLEWSIQNGQLQFLLLGQPLNPIGPVLSSTTGMIGSPTVDNKGIVSVSSLMNPAIYPGCAILLGGQFLQGSYRVERCRWRGQTWGDDWGVDMEGRPLSAV